MASALAGWAAPEGLEAGRQPLVKLKDMVKYLPTKGRALLEMTVQNIFFDRKTLIFAGLSFLLLLIPGYWAYSYGSGSLPGLDLFALVALLIYLQFIVLYACLLFGASQFAEEEEQKTITYLTSRPITSLELVLYKYLGFVAVVFVMFLVPLLLNFAIIATHTSYETTSGFLFELGQYIGLLLLAVVAWGAFFMLLGVALGKQSLMAGLLYALLWETFMANIPTGIRYATVTYYLRSLAPGSDPAVAAAWGQNLAALLGFALVCLVLAWFIQRRKDYN